MKTNLLEGKVAVVTGGSRGIGACISRVLAAQGATVAALYATGREPAEAVVGQITNAGGRGRAFQCDVRDSKAVTAVLAEVKSAFGRIDGLINNAVAGRQNVGFDEATWTDYTDMFDFGCKAVVNTVKAVRPIMKDGGGGRIVNIVTEIWNLAPGQWTTYLAGKGAMVGVSRSLAVELGPDNITVNMVAPGWMVTENVDTASEGSKGFAAGLPLRRHGSADEIGHACVFFLSGLASYVTGAYLPVTGGRITQMGA
ncbi:MAG: SDR family oxidoreductase [Puniceicoccaceae bacterium]|nr:MAG: SDR family oxidoreductase [Puniceicoccaceae bacterium]